MIASHLILALLAENPGGKIAGRTILQKQVYFAALKLSEDYHFTPYFYGPYSAKVSDALDNLVGMNFVGESVQAWGSGQRYEYSLAEDGRKMLRALKGDRISSAEVKEVRHVVETLLEERLAQDTPQLSCAAKVHFIVGRAGRKISLQEVQTEAKTLGWAFTTEEAKQVLGALKKLGLVESES